MRLDNEFLGELARLIDSKLPDNHGLILLTFPFGDDSGGGYTYTSNAKRESAIAAMKEFLINLIEASGKEESMTHIK
jgi:hypothetical protein